MEVIWDPFYTCKRGGFIAHPEQGDKRNVASEREKWSDCNEIVPNSEHSLIVFPSLDLELDFNPMQTNCLDRA